MRTNRSGVENDDDSRTWGMRDRAMRPLDEFLPVFEFSERHRLAIAASPDRIDAAVRTVSLTDIPAARFLWWLRRLGRPYGDAGKPFVAALESSVVLDDIVG